MRWREDDGGSQGKGAGQTHMQWGLTVSVLIEVGRGDARGLVVSCRWDTVGVKGGLDVRETGR